MIFRSKYFKDSNAMKKDKNEAHLYYLYRVEDGRDDGRYKSVIMTICIPKKLAKVWSVPSQPNGDYLVRCETVFDTSEISYKYVLYNKYIGKIVSRCYDGNKPSPEEAMSKDYKLELPYYIEYASTFYNTYEELNKKDKYSSFDTNYIVHPSKLTPPAIIKITEEEAKEKDIYSFSESNIKEGESIKPEWSYGGLFVHVPELFTYWGVFWKDIPENWKDYTVPGDFHREIDSIPCDYNFWIINEQGVAIPVDHNSMEYKEMISFKLGDGTNLFCGRDEFYYKILKDFYPIDLLHTHKTYTRPILKEDENGKIKTALECDMIIEKPNFVLHSEIKYPLGNGDYIYGYVDWRKFYGKYEHRYIRYMDSCGFKEFNDIIEKEYRLGTSDKYREYDIKTKKEIKEKDRKEIHILKVYRDPSKTFPEASVSMVLEIPERLAKIWKIPYNKFTKPMVRAEYSSTVEYGFFRYVDVDFYYYPVEIVNKNIVIGEEIKIERDSETYHDMKCYDLNGGYLIKGVDLGVPMEIERWDKEIKGKLNYTREETNDKYDTDRLYRLTFGTQYYKEYKMVKDSGDRFSDYSSNYSWLKINNDEEMNLSISLSSYKDETPWFRRRFNMGCGASREEGREIGYYGCISTFKFDEYNKKAEDVTGIDL